jgi:hypothetical protein
MTSYLVIVGSTNEAGRHKQTDRQNGGSREMFGLRGKKVF